MRNTKRRRTDVADGKTMTTLRIRKRLCNKFHSVLSLDSKGYSSFTYCVCLKSMENGHYKL